MFIRTLFVATTLAALSATTALAAEMTVGDLTVSDAWTRATAPRAKNGGAFVTIRNNGSADDRLVAASTEAAGKTELHTHKMEGGMMKMRPVVDIPVPAGETVTLQPGGLHVMMLGLKAPLAKDSTVAVTLTFEKAGSVTLDVPIMAAGAQGMKHERLNGHGDTKKNGMEGYTMDRKQDDKPHGMNQDVPKTQ